MANKNKVTAPVAETIVIKKGEPIKNMLNAESLRNFASAIKSVYEPFPVDEFVISVMDGTWEGLELKARGRQVTINLKKYLPENYADCIAVFDKVVVKLFPSKDSGNHSPGFYFLGMSFNDFIEVFGQEEKHWDLSVSALGRYTQYWSAEFAVRPFIINNEERMMAQMLAWSKHENEHVRRLASEGSRPALPWAMALPKFKKDPTPILPTLTQLRSDPSEYVSEFALDTASVSIGNDFNFSFVVSAKEATKARLEYGMDYVKSNGKTSRKIFKLSEVSLKTNEKRHIRASILLQT